MEAFLMKSFLLEIIMVKIAAPDRYYPNNTNFQCLISLRVEELSKTDELQEKMWFGKIPCIIPVIFKLFFWGLVLYEQLLFNTKWKIVLNWIKTWNLLSKMSKWHTWPLQKASSIKTFESEGYSKALFSYTQLNFKQIDIF